MLRNAPAGIHTIRDVMGVCHLLADASGDTVLLDTGLTGEPWLIRSRLARLSLRPDSIKPILLTHGHIDHAGNLAWAKAFMAHRSTRIRPSKPISTAAIRARASTYGTASSQAPVGGPDAA